MWPFSYKAWILSRVFKLQVLYTAAVKNGVIAEWKKLQRVKVRKLYSDHLFQKQFTFWWARVRLICKKNPLWNPLIIKNLLVPSEFGCKVVVQYMLLADIYVVCNCIFAADRLWRSGLYLHKRPLLLCWISRRWNQQNEMRSLASVLHDVSSLFNSVFYDYMLPTFSFFINLYIEKKCFPCQCH